MHRKINIRGVRFIACALVFSAVFALFGELGTGGVNAYSQNQQELEARIDEIRKENEAIDKEIGLLSDSIAEQQKLQGLYLEKMNAVTEEIDALSNLIYENEQQIELRGEAIEARIFAIDEKEEQIAETQGYIDEIAEQNAENLMAFGDILAELYMTGNDMTGMIANASSLYDWAVITETLQNISKRNLEFMDELLWSIQEQENLIGVMNAEIRALELEAYAILEEQEMLALEKLELEKQVEESEKLSAEYRAFYEEYAEEIAALEARQRSFTEQKQVNQAEADDFDKQLQKLIRAAQTSNNYVEGGWLWPVDSSFKLITTYFGYDAWRGGMHNGIDIGDSGINWANIYAAKSGTVTLVQKNYIAGYSYGKYVVIDHGGGYTTLYAHCNDIYVSVGQWVEQGQVIASVGSTGWSTGPHLHFEVRVGGVPKNPLNYIS